MATFDSIPGPGPSSPPVQVDLAVAIASINSMMYTAS